MAVSKFPPGRALNGQFRPEKLRAPSKGERFQDYEEYVAAYVHYLDALKALKSEFWGQAGATPPQIKIVKQTREVTDPRPIKEGGPVSRELHHITFEVVDVVTDEDDMPTLEKAKVVLSDEERKARKLAKNRRRRARKRTEAIKEQVKTLHLKTEFARAKSTYASAVKAGRKIRKSKVPGKKGKEVLNPPGTGPRPDGGSEKKPPKGGSAKGPKSGGPRPPKDKGGPKPPPRPNRQERRRGLQPAPRGNVDAPAKVDSSDIPTVFVPTSIDVVGSAFIGAVQGPNRVILDPDTDVMRDLVSKREDIDQATGQLKRRGMNEAAARALAERERRRDDDRLGRVSSYTSTGLPLVD